MGFRELKKYCSGKKREKKKKRKNLKNKMFLKSVSSLTVERKNVHITAGTKNIHWLFGFLLFWLHSDAVSSV